MATGSWGRSAADVWTCTYRLLRTDRSLVYVGVTDNLESRMRNHSRRHWWHEVAAKDVIWFPDRLSALYEESRAIDFEDPTYNDREGISPFGLQPLTQENGEPAAAVVTRYDKDRFFAQPGPRTPARLTQYGAPTDAVVVSIDWYRRANELLGSQVDMETVATCPIDKL